MRLVVDKRFQRSFKRLVKKNSQLKGRILGVLDVLEQDPFTASLKSHKLTGNLNKYWSCSVSYDCRILFIFSEDIGSDEMLIILVDIGSHDDFY